MKQKQTKSLTKITKVTLVIYCSLALCGFIGLIIPSVLTNNYSLLWGFLLCLGPGIIYVLVTCLFPISKVYEAKSGKGPVIWYVVLTIIKFGLIIGIPFIGLTNPLIFNQWTMLATTLVAPLLMLISKALFANYVSKNSKTDEKKTQNSIKF